MSYADLLDHTATIFRPTETLDAQRSTVRTYAASSEVRAGMRRPSAQMQDTGPGLTATGSRVIYLLPDADVLERDVLRFDTGPETATRWEVDQPPSHIRGHHIEVRARHFSGKLPGDS